MTVRKALSILCLLPCFLWSQLQVKNYFALTGKKDISVNVITQDPSGYLWLGTTEGLYRYDGRSASAVVKSDQRINADITALLIDDSSRIWLGTRSGRLYVYHRSQLDSVKLRDSSGTKITSIVQARNSICVATYGDGLYIVQGKKMQRHLTKSSGLSDDVIYKLAVDSKQRIWCGTDAGLTYIDNLVPKPVIGHFSSRDGLPDNIVRDISGKGNQLLISMQDSGICYVNADTRHITRPQFFHNWSLGTVLNAIERDSGNLVVATERNGLLTIEHGEVNVYSYLSYLQGGAVNQLFRDRENQLWLASKKGVSHFSERRYQFISSGQEAADQKVLAITQDLNNNLWVGTASGIVKIMKDDQGKTVIRRLLESEKYTVSCAAVAPDGRIWFGTYGSGIIVFDNNDKPIFITSQAYPEMNDNISHIFFTKKGKVLVSTLGGGLVVGQHQPQAAKQPFTIEKVLHERNGLGSDYVYASLADDNERIFVASDGGGLQLLENGKITDLSKMFMPGSNTAFTLCRDRHNNIWAVTSKNGIIKYNGKSIKALRNADGLRDEQPQQLVAAGDVIYALNTKGIDKINCLTDTVTYYDIPETELEPNLNAVCLSRGRLYSGTNSGIFVFRTATVAQDSIRPVAALKRLLLNYKEIPFDSLSEYSHSQNNFAFEFDGLWLKNPDKLVYRYKLQGLETDWQYSQTAKAVNYNNLKPGTYSFVVQVKNEEDIWSEEVSYGFEILTPIYMRWWFWVICLAAAAALFYLFVRYRLKALQRENLILEQRVKERTFQIERQTKIIEKKNAELEQLSLVASKTDNVVLILDAEGRLEYINESFEKTHGISTQELKEKYGETIYELSNHPDIRNIINDAVSGKHSVSYESLNRKLKNGADVWESSTLTPIFDEQGQLKKIIIIDTDVSLRKKQEQIITQKNKDITDSISYARKIQHAILPAATVIRDHLPKSFILYMTKDIVSGDFYWFAHFNGISIIAAVDCTGHGVPGAFMSLIGYNQLNRIINEEKITNPRNILLELNTGVLGVLHKNESESKDGMDIAICKIDHEARSIEYAGAMRPLWIIRNREGTPVLTEIKPDKIPVGTKADDRSAEITFTTHKVDIAEGDRFYIFTDGYADQFGGAKDKKYSTARFRQLLVETSHLSMEQQEAVIKEEHLKWKGDNEQIDDILVIGFSF